MTNRQEIEQQIGRDLDLCDLGIALAKGKLKKQYKRHRKACFDEIRKMNEKDGLSNMLDDDLLRELLT